MLRNLRRCFIFDVIALLFFALMCVWFLFSLGSGLPFTYLSHFKLPFLSRLPSDSPSLSHSLVNLLGISLCKRLSYEYESTERKNNIGTPFPFSLVIFCCVRGPSFSLPLSSRYSPRSHSLVKRNSNKTQKRVCALP